MKHVEIISDGNRITVQNRLTELLNSKDKKVHQIEFSSHADPDFMHGDPSRRNKTIISVLVLYDEIYTPSPPVRS